MDDKKLQMLAAKAAGVELHGEFCKALGFPARQEQRGWWCPLADDGDALRLAVKLGIRIANMGGRACAFSGLREFWDPEGDDPVAATRRAIVRAAAEIGRAMP